MRSAVASILAAGVLALGAVPTTLALADEDTTKKEAGHEAAGPPSWAAAHGHGKSSAKGADKRAEKTAALAQKRKQQANWSEDQQGPPPWARAYGKKGDQAARAKAHAKAMEQWSACVTAAEAKATETQRREARSECEKPIPPGHRR